MLEFAVEGVGSIFRSFGVVVKKGVEGLGEEIVGFDLLPVDDGFACV